MDQQQQELRHAAAQAFMESLEQLQVTLQQSDGHPPRQPSAPPKPQAAPIDLNMFEQAIADIDEFMQHHDQPAEGDS